jgi:thiol-disulfide isomerase/thioredoxin
VSSFVLRLRLGFPAWLAVLALGPALVRAQESALDLEGHVVNPLVADTSKVTVLVFVRRDCPVSSRYAPSIQQISKHYADRADFWLVYPDKTDSPQAIRKYLQDYGYHLPALRDPGHVLVKLGHAQITPEVAVFDREGQLVYDGRIDDWFVELGRARPAPTTHELEDALRAALAGKPVAKSEVRGVGCYISDLE